MLNFKTQGTNALVQMFKDNVAEASADDDASNQVLSAILNTILTA